ncbi:MAG TPA: tetratricopeptide repeat protein, partial [Vicinamibacteria bacterium]
HLHLAEGDVTRAERALREALGSFPGYHYALGQLARVRTAQGRHVEAAALLRERQKAADHPENRYELAEALERAGEKMEARAAFSEFERAARAESAGPDNANRELVFYYTDHARKADEALRIAAGEAASRQDVYTLDAHAWALWAKGRKDEARLTLGKALAVGVRDPRVLEHARVLGLK